MYFNRERNAGTGNDGAIFSSKESNQNLYILDAFTLNEWFRNQDLIAHCISKTYIDQTML